jgi:FtsP/CotA-like multicopper oxidase with cupredoxin domain
MAGLIIGITVLPAINDAARAEPSSPLRIRLFANERSRVFGERPGYGFVVQEDGREPAPDSIRIPGTPLLLERGRPVAITVLNRLQHPISVHWHGIELESYFDGVADWSGMPGRTAPAIAPGDSFIARFTPPRAGTFIYHVHMEAKEDLASGLYGTLLVLEPGKDHDAEADRVFLISQSGPGSSRGAERPPFVNGSLAPDTIGLKSGATYRFRLIGISADDLYFVRLLNGTELLQWRPIARHGADLSPSQRAEVPAREQVAPGTTYDFEFSPSMRADLVLEVDVVHVNSGAPARTPTVVPIRVR